LRLDLIGTQTRRRRHRPGAVLVRATSRLIPFSGYRFELFHHAYHVLRRTAVGQRCEWSGRIETHPRLQEPDLVPYS
jgi:hypothetical protein